MGNQIGPVEIHWLHAVGVNFVFMCGLMLVLSRLMPSNEPGDTIALTPALSGWWPLAKPNGACVIVLVFAIYTVLHQLDG